MRSTPILLATLLGLLLTGCDKPQEEQQRDSMSGPQESPQQYQDTVAEPPLEERPGSGTGERE